VVPISHNVATFVWREIAGDQHPKTEAKESSNAVVKTLYTLDQAVFGGIGALSASKLVVERSVEAVREVFSPPADDHQSIIVEDRLAAIIKLKGQDKDFTLAEALALKYGYKYQLNDGKLVFFDHNGNSVDIERNYQLDQRHRAELAYIKILEEYYAGKKQHVPYGATLAVFDGDEPYVASDGKLYFKKPDGHKGPASKYEKHKFDPNEPPKPRPQPTTEISAFGVRRRA
jgi:hypothetical protein